MTQDLNKKAMLIEQIFESWRQDYAGRTIPASDLQSLTEFASSAFDINIDLLRRAASVGDYFAQCSSVRAIHRQLLNYEAQYMADFATNGGRADAHD